MGRTEKDYEYKLMVNASWRSFTNMGIDEDGYQVYRDRYLKGDPGGDQVTEWMTAEERKQYHNKCRVILQEMLDDGTYGDKMETTLRLRLNPLLDDPKIPTVSPVSSHRITFLDFSQIDVNFKSKEDGSTTG